MFMDPAAGDFRVKDGSPALKLGFRNFPMDQFGVKKPSLKSVAKTPVIPPLMMENATGAQPAQDRKQFWLGAEIRGIEGEEFSAFGVSRDEGGVQVTGVPAGSAAARAGFKANDLIQGINGRAVSNTGQLHAALIAAGDAPLKVRVIRNQQAQEILAGPVPLVIAESSNDAGGFSRIAPPGKSSGVVLTNRATNNDPPGILTDGRLAKSYGPVFGNGVRNGAYKIDLGSSKPVAAITSWSFNQNGNRGRQIVTIHGSNSATDPGWNLADTSLFTPLATLDTASLPAAGFTAASLRSPEGQSLGSFRWVVWETAPLNPAGENTAYQEFSVETAP
jgi:membrane-associated protease RseP (regulator of RpoE activity)